MSVLALALVLAATEQSAEAGKAFEQARGLMKAKSYAEACPLFEKSLALEPALGTLLNLAVCLESWGRTASAFVRYNEAEVWATRTRETARARLAAGRAEALKASLAYVSLMMELRPPGVEATVGGTRVPLTASNHVLAVDPGPVAVLVEAPGHKAWTGSVEASAQNTVPVVVPELVPLPPVKVAGKAAEPEPTPPPMPKALAVSPPPQPPTLGGAVVETRPSSTPGQVRTGPLIGLIVSAVVTGVGLAGLIWSVQMARHILADQVKPSASVYRADYDRVKTVYPVALVGVGVGVVGAMVSSYFMIAKPMRVSPMPVAGGAGVSFSWSLR